MKDSLVWTDGSSSDSDGPTAVRLSMSGVASWVGELGCSQFANQEGCGRSPVTESFTRLKID